MVMSVYLNKARLLDNYKNEDVEVITSFIYQWATKSTHQNHHVGILEKLSPTNLADPNT